MKDFKILGIGIVLIGIALYGMIYYNNTSVNSPKDVEFNGDTLLLSKLLFSECSKCPIGEILLVGSVVLNRLEDGRWGNTLQEVIFSPNQFEGVSSNNWDYTREFYQLAIFLLEYGPISKKPLYFHGKTNKSYVKKLKIYSVEKYHTFAYEN